MQYSNLIARKNCLPTLSALVEESFLNASFPSLLLLSMFPFTCSAPSVPGQDAQLITHSQSLHLLVLAINMPTNIDAIKSSLTFWME